MELQIQDLVSSIKKEGIDAANATAEQIVSEAKAKAEAITADAKKEAEALVKAAESRIELMTENAKVTILQAKRDAVLSFKSEVQTAFETLLSKEVSKVLDSEALAALIKAALSSEDVSKYSAELSSVKDSLKSELAQEIKKGLEIRPVADIPNGFRISAKDGSGYFDCTDEEIAKMLSHFMGELEI